MLMPFRMNNAFNHRKYASNNLRNRKMMENDYAVCQWIHELVIK